MYNVKESMKNISSILLFTLVLSVLSCGSETKSDQSTAKSEKSSTKQTTNSNGEIVSGNSDTPSDSKQVTNDTPTSGDPSEVVINTTPLIAPNGDTVVATSNPIIKVLDDYDFHSFDQLNSLLKKYVSAGESELQGHQIRFKCSGCNS